MASISNVSDDILISRIEDTVRLVDKRGAPCYVGFLDLREQALVLPIVKRSVEDDSFRFYGGYSEAERQMLAIFAPHLPPDDSDFPFTAVAFQYRKQKSLSHRDVLGTLMSLGLRRDAIGDILCGSGYSVAFVRDEVVGYITEQVDRIGGEGVSVMPYYDGDLPIHIEYEQIRETIASPRLDVLVKTLARISREDAAELIRGGYVALDHLPVESVSRLVSEGNTLSMRGYGRYYIDQIGPETKKGRLLLKARRRL